MKKITKTRTWLLYVFVVILVVSAGALVYRVVNTVIGGDEIANDEVVGHDSSYYAAIDRKHSFSDSWSGNKSGGVVEWVMSDVITHNKKYPDEPIQLIFGNVDCGADINCITKEKKKLADMNDYEISYEYNNKGSVYMVRISSGPANLFMLIPLIMVSAIAFFMIFGVIRTASRGRKITKKIMDTVEDGIDEL